MDSKISELDLVSVVDQNDVLPIVNGGITKKVKVSQLEQDLQSVTDKGATTNKTINFTGGIITSNISGDGDVFILGVGANYIEINDVSSSITVNAPDFIVSDLISTPSIEVNLGNTNKGVIIESGTSSTGNPIEVKKNGVLKFRVAQNGDVTTDVISANGDILVLEASNVQISLDDTGSTVTVSGADFIANQSINTPLVEAGLYRIPALNTAPATATSTGILGEIRYTSDFIYVCIATNTWRRTALTAW
jgi:hypothetical protein